MGPDDTDAKIKFLTAECHVLSFAIVHAMAATGYWNSSDDKKFLTELEKGCNAKEAEWAERCKARAEELLALSDTTKILNGDDALELFKKTLSGSSLLQTSCESADTYRVRRLPSCWTAAFCGGAQHELRSDVESRCVRNSHHRAER